MRRKTMERVWCDEHGLTMSKARRLGGYLRLMELQKNQPEIFRLLMTDTEKMAMAHRKVVAA
jgi:hypothetical protein